VTPYKGQVKFIKNLIRERKTLEKFRTGLEVESVDGFQGQEKEVIIFCAVRNNREGKVGFLSDWRRLNVMLTRARRGCIVIGSKATLNQDPLWQEWLKWATARGAICGEGAKGTWVPRYMVDDRDGVWTVKGTVAQETAKGNEDEEVVMIDATKLSAAVIEEDPPDNWDDDSDEEDEAGNKSAPGSPKKSAPSSPKKATPSSPSKAAAAAASSVFGISEAMEAAAVPDFPVSQPEEEISRAQEMRAEREKMTAARGDPDDSSGSEEEEGDESSESEADEAGSTGAPVPGSPAAGGEGKGEGKGSMSPTGLSRQLSRQSDEGEDSPDEGQKRTPMMSPKSPSQKLALAKLGLIDDLDLDD